MGGLKFDMFGMGLEFGVFSYLITLFWFILFINAVNLADGLDGLAGGIICFVASVMVILSILNDNYVVAMMFTALSGSVLGFLRYNFNPASIFLGDGGSYFFRLYGGFAIDFGQCQTSSRGGDHDSPFWRWACLFLTPFFHPLDDS